MTKSIGPRPETCSILALMVQRGEIAEGKKFLSTIDRRYGKRRKSPPSPHRGLADAILSIWYQMECILGSCLPHIFQKLEGTVPTCSKVGGTRPRPSQPVRKLGGDASHGSHRVVAPMAVTGMVIEVNRSLRCQIILKSSMPYFTLVSRQSTNVNDYCN